MQVEEIFATVRIGSVTKKRIRLSGAGTSFTIGSSPLRCDVFVDSDAVEVVHVIVTIDAAGETVEIEDSTAGNGNKVTVNWEHVSDVYRCSFEKDLTIRIGRFVSILVSRELPRLSEIPATAN